MLRFARVCGLVFFKNNCIHLLLILSLSWYLLCYFNTNQNDSQERLFLQPIIGVPLTSFASFPSCFPDTSLHANLLFGPRFTVVLGNRQQFLFMWTIKGSKSMITLIDREWMCLTDAGKTSEVLLMKLLSISNNVSGLSEMSNFNLGINFRICKYIYFTSYGVCGMFSKRNDYQWKVS